MTTAARLPPFDPERVGGQAGQEDGVVVTPFDPDVLGGLATPPSVETTLAERGKRYGKFTGHAAITQSLKNVMHNARNWEELHCDQAEALEMIVHKIGRILNGDPNYHDSWHDIAGYATLVADRLAGSNVSVAK